MTLNLLATFAQFERETIALRTKDKVSASRRRGMFTGVRAVILDEIHAVAGTKRGAHLAVSLERLDKRLLEASKDLGAARWRTFRQVTLPLTLRDMVLGKFLAAWIFTGIALVLMEMNYVHLPMKRAIHAIDPIQQLKLLRFHLTECSISLESTLDFHRRMLSIFGSTRDLQVTSHTATR